MLVLFAKWPRPGRAKRRLARALGTRAAAPLARSFLLDTIALAATSRADLVLVAYAPPSARRSFAAAANGARLVPQPRRGFGKRLEQALGAGLAAGHRVVLIGADSPTLPPSILRRAFARLAHADLVLGPATDGGYYLIGARAALPGSLFRGMPWSTARVADETLRRAAGAGLRVAVLPAWYDVDDAAGLRRLLADDPGLRRAHATSATLAALGALG